MVLGDADGLAERVRVAAPEANAEGGDGQRNPRARGVIVRHRAMQGDARAAGDLVADDHGGEEVGARQRGFRFQERQDPRQQPAARVALGGGEPVMGVQAVDLVGPGPGGTCCAGHASVEQQPCRGGARPGAKLAERHLADDCRGAQVMGRGRDAEEIEHQVFSPRHDVLRDVLRSQVQHELSERSRGLLKHRIGPI